jgi:hypothetical protein
MHERPLQSGVGIHGIFGFGATNHYIDPDGTTHFLDKCPSHAASIELGDVPSNFTTVGRQPQFSWAEGNDLKLFGCDGRCDGTNCNSTSPGYANLGWHFFLFNLTADRAETTDQWRAQRSTAKAMLARFIAWESSVLHSQSVAENGCGKSGESRDQN